MQIEEDSRKKAVIRALLDDHSRLILTATMLVAKSVIDITREQKIPITSAYRKVKELKEFGLLKVERIVLTPDGKKFELVRSTIRTASIQFDKGTLDVDVTAGIETDEKLVRRFFALREAR
jgi:DNA-binding GntR family transcriptional regulator